MLPVKNLAGCPSGPYDVYARNCPARMVLDRLADKWALLVIGRLRESPLRFNQLRREVDGVSQKVLSQTLKKLERDGLVTRLALPTVPVTVEYSLSGLGDTLASTIEHLSRWAETNMDEILAAQARYDATV
ncbi:MAG: transcriptional regulator [Candidatus Dactylopiibacterium carminicum]|uniref:Transcriptional regulator n=1 Tax=Candidatus Dactylopiibacterium carminicum TaxID=857335 RepID=A0A272EUI0_9RHOO|nr:helix-turn-helix domain-containing protein [Candidatus Dactylopiibacterium carminicum]KAF7599752.1 transcriptional regulator [Candidatus Dactylopiibacterium carminicum]PAS93706.1 MAG: transcriptional regulator [Candidatus Dactylopiibacterium carminicum]PAS98293.1 MAG: transcriptional regulator [Candidatus Dactylopiibacterium carminicum]PAS99753.1 MAG: transcriptional regulator [Candidatus Dactylopiibacterium carminicum]